MSRTHKQELPTRKTYLSAFGERSSKPSRFTRHIEHKKERNEGRQLTKRYTTYQSQEEE